ncbi:MAG TPA: hypothetical protein VFV38_21270 [Ktedonobacteraceae bacterium]|nr:hypothetical protein [Ktedonobacteraceae bacterium]
MNTVRHYLLPLLAVVETMKGLPEMVSLHAEVPSVPGLARGTYLAHVVVGQGRCSSCTITTPTGRLLLQQQEAFDALQQVGNLAWRLSAPPSASMSALVQTEAEFQEGDAPERGRTPIRPRRIGRPEPAHMQALPHAQRHLLWVIDGQKTLEQLARLLAKSPDDIYHLLLRLREQHLIHW